MKYSLENELLMKRNNFIIELNTESQELFELIEKLELDVKKLDLMNNFDKCSNYEKVFFF